MHRTGNEQQRARHEFRRPAWLSYPHVAATLALFFALTGTAAAAVTLARDSVGAEHIQADAVGTSEIQVGAVRSAEILDETIALADLAPGARSALDAPRIRVDHGGEIGYNAVSPECPPSLLACSNLLAVHLPAGRWLVQAKLDVFGSFANLGNTCGLVESDMTVVDAKEFIGLGTGDEGQTSEEVVLSAVVTTAPDVDSTTIAVRCNEHVESENIYWKNGKLTAIEVKDEAQAG
jgi:hypothetical protein